MLGPSRLDLVYPKGTRKERKEGLEQGKTPNEAMLLIYAAIEYC